jgi:O-antigen/teichoic acid export membrane protein
VPSLRKNITALYIVQMATYAIPLITVPWLTRVLGPDGFGRFNFCMAFNAYFVLLADYGFNFSATQEIARHRDDKIARSRIFWSTCAVKTLLALAGLVVLLLSTLFVEQLAADRSLLLVGYLAVAASVLTPSWYFQGTENIALFSAINVFFRGLSVPMTFLFVTSRDSVFAAIAVNVGALLLTGLACLLFLCYRRSLSFVAISCHDLLSTLQEGWHLFISTAAMSLYSTTNVVLLGFTVGNAAVGYFSAAEKLVKAVSGLTAPLTQSFYPRISRLMDGSRSEAFGLIRRLLRIQGSIGLGVSVLLFAAAPYVVQLLYGPAFTVTSTVLRWLSLLPLLLGISNVLGVQAMLTLRMSRTVSGIVLSAGALNVALLFILSSFLGAVGAGMAVLITETVVTASMIVVLRSKGIPIFPAWMTKMSDIT